MTDPIDPSQPPDPTAHEIAEIAYRRFLERGQEHGSDLEDWLAAEQEVRLRYAGNREADTQPTDQAAAIPAERRRPKRRRTARPNPSTPSIDVSP
jgi:hypothetical protein